MFRLEVIDFIDQSNQTIVGRVPELGTAAIQYGAQLIVQQNQEAIFFRDGRAMDKFGPGRHTLTTANIPILTKILTIPWEKSPFQACVYFVGKQTFLDQRWGTRQPITLRDKDFGIVRLRGFGKFAFRVADPSLLLNTVVGTQGKLTTEEITNYLRDQIVAGMTDLLATAGISLLDLPAKFDELGGAARVKMGEEFTKLGLELTQFTIASITPPEEVEKAIDARSSMTAVGDLRSFTIYQAANGMAAAGQNPSGVGAAGIGMGMGMVLPSLLQQAMQGQAGQSPPSVGAVGIAGNRSFEGMKLPSDAMTPRQLLEQLAAKSNWRMQANGDHVDVTVALGPMRRQTVQIGFQEKDSEGHDVVSVLSVCGPAESVDPRMLLRLNNQLIHGAFALRTANGSEQLVLRENLLADTMDPLELSRAIAAVAWQADQAEQQLSGANDGF